MSGAGREAFKEATGALARCRDNYSLNQWLIKCRPSLYSVPQIDTKAPAMLSPRQARFAFLPLMLVAMSALIGLAVVVFRQGLAQGAEEAWMLAWVLAFIIALPSAMLLMPAVSAVLAHYTRGHSGNDTRHGIIPMTGEKVPGAGQ